LRGATHGEPIYVEKAALNGCALIHPYFAVKSATRGERLRQHARTRYFGDRHQEAGNRVVMVVNRRLQRDGQSYTAFGLKPHDLIAELKKRLRLQAVVILIRRSKTDQEGAGHEMAIPNGRYSETYPVLALQTWIATAGVTDGPIFRAVDKPGRVSPGLTRPNQSRRSSSIKYDASATMLQPMPAGTRVRIPPSGTQS
jgi:hypothetical protein